LLDASQLEASNYNTLGNETCKTELSKFGSSTNSLNAASLSENGEVVNSGNKEDLEKNFGPDESTTEYFTPFSLPSSTQTRVETCKFYACWPLMFLFYISIPNCRRVNFQKYFILTFVLSLVWLCLLSYMMVWMITVIGYTFSIPDSVMGITFIAFGASVPDALSSLLVAKNGKFKLSLLQPLLTL
jgi:Ca2+/Na+ antiporter